MKCVKCRAKTINEAFSLCGACAREGQLKWQELFEQLGEPTPQCLVFKGSALGDVILTREALVILQYSSLGGNGRFGNMVAFAVGGVGGVLANTMHNLRQEVAAKDAAEEKRRLMYGMSVLERLALMDGIVIARVDIQECQAASDSSPVVIQYQDKQLGLIVDTPQEFAFMFRHWKEGTLAKEGETQCVNLGLPSLAYIMAMLSTDAGHLDGAIADRLADNTVFVSTFMAQFKTYGKRQQIAIMTSVHHWSYLLAMSVLDWIKEELGRIEKATKQLIVGAVVSMIVAGASLPFSFSDEGSIFTLVGFIALVGLLISGIFFLGYYFEKRRYLYLASLLQDGKAISSVAQSK